MMVSEIFVNKFELALTLIERLKFKKMELKNKILLLCFFLASTTSWAQIKITPTNPDCRMENGEMTVDVIAGYKRPFKLIEWKNSAGDIIAEGTTTISGLGSGEYCVSIVDARDCPASTCAVLNSSDLKVYISSEQLYPVVVDDQCDDEIRGIDLTANHTGGAGPVSLSWEGTKTITALGGITVPLTGTDSLGCFAETEVFINSAVITCPKDPNDITGPPGFGEEKWVAGTDKLPYRVRFENDPEFATAHARIVRIEHPFDQHIDPYSFRLSNFGFANMDFEVPTNSTFYAERLDVVDSLGVLVDVTAGIDLERNLAFWIFESVDPTTGLLPSDPFIGILPVNDTISRKGEGYVTFTVVPDSEVQTRDSIVAVADIIFDFNEIISTPPYTNIIDAGLPSSTLLSANPVGNEIVLEWSGEDDPLGSGIQDYSIYYSKDEQPFQLFRENLEETNISYFGEPGHTYSFFTRAKDNVGNQELLKGIEEAIVVLENVPGVQIITPSINRLCSGDSITINWNSYQVGMVNISLSSASNQFSEVIATNLAEGTAPAIWPIPNDFSCEDCILRIADVSTDTIEDFTVAFNIFANPTLNAGEDLTICSGEETQLAATGAQYYLWDEQETLTNNNIPTPTIHPTSTTTYQVTGTSLTGCVATDEITVAVQELPTIEFNLNTSIVCDNQSPILLEATPVGGTFNGYGVANGSFDPTITGAGIFAINYIFEDANGCINNASNEIEVQTSTPLSFSGLAATYSLQDPASLLSGTPANGVFSGPGISDNTFNAALAGSGTHQISYTIVNENNCTSTATQTVIVFADDAVFFTGLPEVYCQNEAPITLVGNPMDGIFSGPGIEGEIFNPNTAGVGDHEITYLSNGVSYRQTITVSQVTPLSIAGLQDSMCLVNSLIILNGNPVGGQLIGDGLIGNELNLLSAGVGTHTYTYSLEQENGCSSFISRDILVFDLPSVSFTGLNTFYTDTDEQDTLIGIPAGGTFTGPGILDSIFYPSIVENGFHTITYSFTNQNGCTNTVAQEVEIFAENSVFIAGLASYFCENDPPITLTGNPIGGTFSGSGITNNIFDPAQAGTGPHIIEYSVVNSSGNIETVYGTTIVTAQPAIYFPNLENNYCLEEESIQLDAEPEGGTWSGVGVSGDQFFLSEAGLGNHTISYFYENENGCSSNTEHVITITNTPEVSIQNLSQSYCIDDNPTTLILIPPGGTLSGPGIVGQQFYPDFAGEGQHTINYTFTNANGCIGSTTLITQVSSNSAVSFSGIENNQYCLGGTVELTGNPAGGTFSGPGMNGNIFTPTEVGTITISYTVNNGNCSGTYNQDVTVESAPNLVIDVSPPSMVTCQGDSIILNTITDGSTFLWSTDETQAAISVFTTGTYSVTTTDNNGCTNTSDVSVVVHEPNTPSITLVADSLISSPGISYQWYLDDVLIVNATNDFFVPVMDGTYTVVTLDNNGCLNTSEPFLFTTTNIQSLELYTINIRPNPVKDYLEVAFVTNTTLHQVAMEIMDVKGRQVFQQKYGEVNGSFLEKADVSNLPSGTYLIRILALEGIFTEKIIKVE